MRTCTNTYTEELTEAFKLFASLSLFISFTVSLAQFIAFFLSGENPRLSHLQPKKLPRTIANLLISGPVIGNQ